MRYLSFDLEATGLEQNDLIIEFACLPIDVKEKTLVEELSFHRFIYCPSFDELKPKLNPWVIKNNETLIKKAHLEGEKLATFKESFESYLNKPEIQKFFNHQPIVLFGKSINAIDLPFLNRDLGWEFMRKYFSHRVQDLSSISYAFMDKGILPAGSESGSKLMEFLKMGEVAHTALEDSVNTAKMYFKILDL